MDRLLEGIRVLDWTMFQNGSAAGYMLGDLGAEVIHIEKRITGDAVRGLKESWGSDLMLSGGRSMGFETSNRSKKSITLDLAKDRGREVLYRLVTKSDVFLTNFRRGIARKLRVDYESLCEQNPRIVYCNATVHGAEGPDNEIRGFDMMGQARSGIMFQFGDRDHTEPLHASGGIADQLGATMAAWGITAALLGRELRGYGQEVGVSLLGSLIHQQSMNVSLVALRGRQVSRHSRKRAGNPLANMYRCGDGNWLVVAELQSDRYWRAFCDAVEVEDVVDDPRFATAPARRDNCEGLIALLDNQFAKKPRDYWMQRLRERGQGLACDVVNTLNDLASDPQVLANRYIVDYEHEALGPIKTLGFPISFSKTPARIGSCAPEFGQHTEEILLDVAGYSWDEIQQLREEEII